MKWLSSGFAHVLGDNIPHDGGIISFEKVLERITDPGKIIPLLFAQIDETLIHRIKPGDFIIAGKNFLAGKAHNTGLIGLKALNIGILCESMGARAFQGVVATAVPCLVHCKDITKLINDGDEIEVDFLSGVIKNITQKTVFNVPRMDDGIKVMIEKNGLRGLLSDYLNEHPDLKIPFDLES